MRTCKACNFVKPDRQFGKSVKTLDRKSLVCKSCESAKICGSMSPKRIKALEGYGITEHDESLFGEICRVGHDMNYEPTKTPIPTGTLIGSKERIEVYQKRLMRGEILRHELDNPMLATLEEQAESRRIAAARYGRKCQQAG